MNEAHLHLIVNHFPIIAPILGLIVLLGGFLTRSAIVKRVACSLFIIGALFTFAAGATGEGAEHAVKELGISHDIVHEHEEAAEIFILFSYALGVAAIAGLWANYRNKSFSTIVNVVIVALSIVAIFLGTRAGTTGGEIRHTEIRGDSPEAISE